MMFQRQLASLVLSTVREWTRLCRRAVEYDLTKAMSLTSRRSQQPIERCGFRKSVGFTTSQFGCGSAFFVRRFALMSKLFEA